MASLSKPTVAEAYDRWFDAPWGRYAFRVESQALFSAAGSLTGRSLIDVGCGTGRLSRELENLGARVVGLDGDAAMLAVASRRLRGSLVLGDARTLPVADGTIDVAIAVTLCEFASDVASVFSELARITRPGGCFIVGSLNPRSPWGFFNRGRFRRPPWKEARFLTRHELLRLGRQHGEASIHAALYAPTYVPGLLVIGALLEKLGHAFPSLGAFQVLVVRRPV